MENKEALGIKDETALSKISEIKNNLWISLWLKRLAQYLALFGIVVIPGTLIISWINVIPTDTDNALYFLSAMVQSQAAIVSLVITLTLIAIQMAAGSYTPRVVDVMKKSPDMWFLLIIYVESISIGFIALKMVTHPDQSFVSLILILGIYTFLTLFLYIINTINLLRPDEIVKMLVSEINVRNIHQKEWTDDIMQPVFDVVHASINRFDVTTTRTGLNQLSKRILVLYPTFDNDARVEIAKHFCKHIQRSSLIALGNEDEGTIDEILNTLEKFCIEISKYEEEMGGPYSVISVIHFIGLNAAEKRLETATIRAGDALLSIGQDAIDTEKNIILIRVIGDLESIGHLAANKRLMIATARTISKLGKIGEYAADKGLEDATHLVVNYLGYVGPFAARNGLGPGVIGIVRELCLIGCKNMWKDAAAKSLAKFQFNCKMVSKVIENNVKQLFQGDKKVQFDAFMEQVSEEIKKLEFAQE
jgi:hypothetical protein